MRCRPPDAHAPGPSAGSVTDDDRRRQKKDASEQNNTGQLGGRVIKSGTDAGSDENTMQVNSHSAICLLLSTIIVYSSELSATLSLWMKSSNQPMATSSSDRQDDDFGQPYFTLSLQVSKLHLNVRQSVVFKFIEAASLHGIVRGHPKSLKIAPFSTAHTNCY